MNYFSNKELACPCCGDLYLQPGFLEIINDLRTLVGEPLIVTSACRCPTHNASVGGHKRSLHMFDNVAHATDTCAVDFSVRDSGQRARIVPAALALGLSVGIASNFIHVDMRVSAGLSQVLYHYKR